MGRTLNYSNYIMTDLPQLKTQGWKNILKLIVPYFIGVGSIQLIAFAILGFDYSKLKDLHETPFQLLILTGFNAAGTYLIIWIFRKYVDKKSFVSLGFYKTHISNDVSLGLIIGFSSMLFAIISLLLTNQIQFVKTDLSILDLIYTIGLFAFVALSEELLLRGYILNNLMASFNDKTALIISAVLFSLMHAPNPSFNFIAMINLFLSGLLFGLPYLYTRSLWFPIALHFSWNLFQTLFGFNVSGKDAYSIITINHTIANIWNGGDFGFEASILCILFQLIAIPIVYRFFYKRVESTTITA